MRYLSFETRAALMAGLVDEVASCLASGIEANGSAALAIPGGTTPAPFLHELSKKDIEWNRVCVTLTDERWLSPAHERSNERLVRSTLLQNNAEAARFVPLYLDAPVPEDRLAEIDAAVGVHCQPFDVVVLGMGEDAHTASIFPGADRLDDALDADASALVLPMRADAAPEPRITLTLPALLNARKTFVLITGAKKRDVIQDAVRNNDPKVAPIAAILNKENDVTIAWAP